MFIRPYRPFPPLAGDALFPDDDLRRQLRAAGFSADEIERRVERRARWRARWYPIASLIAFAVVQLTLYVVKATVHTPMFGRVVMATACVGLALYALVLTGFVLRARSSSMMVAEDRADEGAHEPR